MIRRYKFLGILSISTLLIVLSQISFSQSSQINTAYIVTISGDTIRNCEIKKSKRLTNENKITYIYNDTAYSLPSNRVKSYFNNSELYVSELLKYENKYVFINYIIGGSSNFGQAFSRNGESIFFLKSSDTQEVVCLENHKHSLLSLLHSFLPDFDIFYKTYNAKVYYDYESIAELISAYNAFKEPTLFVPVKYKYKENIKFGIYASLGFGNLKLINKDLDFTSKNNFSFGLNFKQFYTRSINFSFSLSYNNYSFIGTIEDVYIKTISFDPNLGFSTMINSKLDISLKGGINLNYNIDSYLYRKPNGGWVLDITEFNFGSQVGVDLTYLKRYSFLITYSSYKIKINDGMLLFNTNVLKATTKTLQFGLLYYFN